MDLTTSARYVQMAMKTEMANASLLSVRKDNIMFMVSVQMLVLFVANSTEFMATALHVSTPSMFFS